MIPLFDLASQYRSIREEVRQAIDQALDNTQYILGPEVAAFENEFATYCECQYGIGMNSGTSALHLALLAAGVGPGDEVISVPFTFVATTAAIRYTGAKPVFVDVEPESLTMDVSRVEAAITPRTKAILPVHLYGQAADMDPILDVARRHGLAVIEDCAQAHGATYKGKRVGSLGQFGCFSFYPSKNLGAYGDSGAVVTNDDGIADRSACCATMDPAKYVHEVEGLCRLDNLQAAVLLVKLPHLDEWNECRHQAAALYNRLLEDVPGVVTPHVPEGIEPVYHLYVIQVPERDRVHASLKAEGIDTGIHYPIPLHQQPAYAHMGHMADDFPISASLGPCILSLPMFAEITPEQIQAVAAAILRALAQ
jgi:dTDP-4-amino-4,6-dideoxygalactose transaminase